MSKKLSTSIFKQAILKGQNNEDDDPAPSKRAVEDNEPQDSLKRRKIADADEEDGLNETPLLLNELVVHHPELATMWDDLKEKKDMPVEPIEQPSYIAVPLLPFQRVDVAWMMRQEKNPDFQGGVLADEMGMGMMMQAITLLLSDNTKPNLVVVPAAGIKQWSSKIEKLAVNNVKVHLYQGANRASTRAELESYDIVITTYKALESAYSKSTVGHVSVYAQVDIEKPPSILHKIEWHRVILDEGNHIHDHLGMPARATFALNGTYKWALTHTPLQERKNEMHSLVKFVKAYPWTFFYCKRCPCKHPNWDLDGGRECPQCGHQPMDHAGWWKDIKESQLLEHMMRCLAKTTSHRQ
ncbi:SNF2 family N-terminal domain-containing protein [Gongronella butleri]|nr:SNF2 family N-terminal domain-containing protein [Gongronella butleri]